MNFKEHDMVILKEDLKCTMPMSKIVAHVIPKGTKGTIIHIYPNIEAIEIEFSPEHGWATIGNTDFDKMLEKA